VAKRGGSTTTEAVAVATAKKLCLLGELPSLSFARFRERPGTDLKTNEGPLSSRAGAPGLREPLIARRTSLFEPGLWRSLARL